MTTNDYYNSTATERNRMVAEARARIDSPAPCNYCGLPTPDGAEFHPICRSEVGPLHSCPDCGATPCPACDPNGNQR